MTPSIGPAPRPDGLLATRDPGPPPADPWRYPGVGIAVRVTVYRTGEHATATGGYRARSSRTVLAADSEGAVYGACLYLGAPSAVARAAAAAYACGDYASLRWPDAGDPEVAVRW